MKIPTVVIEVSLVVFLVIAMFLVMFVAGHNSDRKVVINCSLSEISPDFTTEMREACRQARAKKP
jgi:hypothetical protein